MDDNFPGMTTVLFILLSVVSIEGVIHARNNNYHTFKTLQKLTINDAKLLLHRHRRATTSDEQNVLATEIVLKGTEKHTHAFVHWSGDINSDAVFILTLMFNSTGVVDSQAWKSQDYGLNYSKLAFDKDALVTYFFVSPADNTKMVFTDIKNKRLYLSSDEMKSHQTASLPVPSDNIRMHHEIPDSMLLYDFNERKLYVSTNFGLNWTVLQSDVNSRFYWGSMKYNDSNVVHMEVQPENSEQAYYMRCTIPNCKGPKDGIDTALGPFMSQTLLLMNEFMFVQKSYLDGTHSHMMVSCNRENFSHTYFPDNIKTEDFLIISADEGQVFMAVNHGWRLGVSLYLSDSKGQKYVLSLSRVHYEASSSRIDVDMHEVQGLKGVFLANQIQNSSSSSQSLKSLISYDKGGNWLDIPPQDKSCSSDNCTLLLRLDMETYRQSWILSEENAPAFLIAHGHLGRSYSDDPKSLSIFTSVDGGWTWQNSQLFGVFHFNILDFGSIVTAIKTGEQEETNRVYYTFDKGQTWLHADFGSKNLSVDGVLNEPRINTLLVTVYGHENSSAAWTMVQLNFSQVLTNKCEPSDYEHWYASDHDQTQQENCLLGERGSYELRKRGIRCYNGKDYVSKKPNGTCQCDKEDFECDFGFRAPECVQEPWFDDSYIARECEELKKFNKSRGYRKVASDKCTGEPANSTGYQPDGNATCPLMPPAHLLLIANVSIVANGKPVHFHLSQKKGSVYTTNYMWNFNDTHTVNMTRLEQARNQIHSFSSPGIYYVKVTAANNKGTNSSNLLRIRVEDVVRFVAVYKPWAVNVGFPFTVSVSTNVQTSRYDSLHFLFNFGDEEKGSEYLVTADSHISYTYKTAGTYTISVTAVNGVSALTKQSVITVTDHGVMLQLGFSPNINQLSGEISSLDERTSIFLDVIHQEIARMLVVNTDRLALSLNSSFPVRIHLLVLPCLSDCSVDELSTDQIVQTITDMVDGKMVLFLHSFGLPRSFGEVVVTSVKILQTSNASGTVDKKEGANYRAVYIAIPVALLTGISTTLALFYCRRRFRNRRRYSLVTHHEDTDALLDDDEPPLDFRSDNRDDGRTRDDHMLDLGTGSHLVMVTGSGGGDGAENC